MIWVRILMILAAIWLIGVLFMLTGCAPMPRPPEPVIVTKEVERIVQVRCTDKRRMAPDYPDDDADIMAVAAGDIFGLAQIYRASRELYRQRLLEDDDQIKACAGE